MKKLLLLLLLLPSLANAAVGVDVSSSSSGIGVSSLSWSHTVDASATLLACGAHYAHTTASVSSYTFNAVGLTLKDSVDTGGGGFIEMWSLASPASGAHTVAITMSESTDAMVGGCTSFTGASTLGTAVNTTDIVTGVAVTVPASGMAFGLGVATYAASCVDEAPDTGNTELYEVCADGGGGLMADGFAVSRTTSGQVNWTNRPSGAFEAVLAAPVNPSAGATVILKRRPMSFE